MMPAGSSVGAPCTWERKPSSAYFSARVMPDFASWRLASTSWVLFPMDETIPIPVMTTRLMIASSLSFRCCPMRSPNKPASSSRLRRGVRLEQADPQVLRAIDNLVIGGKPPVGDAQHQLRAHHALDVEIVHDLADVRQHLTGQLQFPEAQRPARPLAAAPDQKKADHLPQRVEAETARHHRIALKMAAEEPQVRLDVQFGTHDALAIFAADRGDF